MRVIGVLPTPAHIANVRLLLLQQHECSLVALLRACRRAPCRLHASCGGRQILLDGAS